MYVLNKYSRFEKSARILLYIFYFVDRLFQRTGNGRYSTLNENVCRSLASKAGLYLSYKVSQLSAGYKPSIVFENHDGKYEMMIPKEYFEVGVTAIIRESFIIQHLSVILSIFQIKFIVV